MQHADWNTEAICNHIVKASAFSSQQRDYMNTEKLVFEETQVINSFFKKRNLLARVENPEVIPFAAIVYKC